MSDNKMVSSGRSMSDTARGGSSGKGTGPTASPRDYPKSGKGMSVPNRTDFNPQKVRCSSIYVGGV